ncbi:MAG: hypothetical protein OXH46_00925 [Gemmatimonadetes bacterium]|nr:hypothetical protein [Gemmatimonadota bacterium]
MIILTAGCSSAVTAPPPAGFGSLTGEWYAQYAVPDVFSEWSLSLTELSTGYVAGTFTQTSYGSLAPPPRPRMRIDVGSIAGEHQGVDILLTFLYEDGRQFSFEGQQVEANNFRVEGEIALDFMRVDPS